MEIVGEAADGQEALQKIVELQPDVVIMDIAMPGMGGVEATKRIKSQYPHVQVLALTMLEDERYFFEIIRAGLGVHRQGCAAGRTAGGRAGGRRRQHLSLPGTGQEPVRDSVSHADMDGASLAADGLTEREQKVLRLISEERTGKEIAKQLQISLRTVDRHRENLMAKLNLHSRTALVKYAIRKGLIENDT